MWKYIKEYRFYIALFLFVLIPIIAIDTSTRSPRDYRLYDKAIIAITSPIQAAVTWVLDSSVYFFNHYLFLFETQNQNQALMDENRRLLNLIVNLKETQEENKRLRQLLNFKESFELKTVNARVIAKDVSTEFRAIRVNRGADHGIQKDMAVVNSEGVIGRVIRTTASTADVVTLLDLLSAVDSIVKRSRVRGIVEGKTDEICQLKFALRTDDIKKGDLLISSGLGGIFPKGIPVGSVIKVVRRPYGITQSVQVQPSVDFSKLEEVLIVTGKMHSPVHVAEQFQKRLNQAVPHYQSAKKKQKEPES